MLPPWTPDLPALDLLLSVAELGSVGRAAQAHHISQPSASARLARLERRLDVALLVRTPRGTTLTPSGEAVAAWARGVVDAAGALTDGVLALRETGNVRLRVAASMTIAEYLMPSWLLTLRRTRPGTEIAVQVANSQDVCERVRTGRADLGFIEQPSEPEGLSGQLVGSDRLALVVAADYPLARRARSGLRPRDLPDLPLLLREPGSGTRDTFLEALGPAELPHSTQLGSTTTIVATARAGGGVAVVSARAVAADLAAGTLVELRVDGLDPVRPLRAVWVGRRAGEQARALIAIAAADPASAG